MPSVDVAARAVHEVEQQANVLRVRLHARRRRVGGSGHAAPPIKLQVPPSFFTLPCLRKRCNVELTVPG